jgi:DNA polymerase I-like protein with 3'-5' exonuclease and polymerase domains
MYPSRIQIYNMHSGARETGFITTLLGRRRYLDNINSPDTKKRSQAERQAVNSVIQGSASDVIKLVTLNIQRELAALSAEDRCGKLGNPQLVMQIHDELIYEVGDLQTVTVTSSADSGRICFRNVLDRQRSEFALFLHRCMEKNVAALLGMRVPLTINVRAGESWGALSDESPHWHRHRRALGEL